jgi:hypothetical protein
MPRFIKALLRQQRKWAKGDENMSLVDISEIERGVREEGSPIEDTIEAYKYILENVS